MQSNPETLPIGNTVFCPSGRSPESFFTEFDSKPGIGKHGEKIIWLTPDNLLDLAAEIESDVFAGVYDKPEEALTYAKYLMDVVISYEQVAL